MQIAIRHGKQHNGSLRFGYPPRAAARLELVYPVSPNRPLPAPMREDTTTPRLRLPSRLCNRSKKPETLLSATPPLTNADRFRARHAALQNATV